MEAVWITLIVILCIILGIILVIGVIKLNLVLMTGWDRSPTCLVGKTAIVTGANTGIGYYTALDFAKRGAKVILACRDPYRAEEARKKIIDNTGNPNVIVKILDLASLASIRKFAVDIKTTEDRLDILVNNAGAGGFYHTMTPDGLSLSMQINHFGPFLLTILLIGLLKKSAPSRVVTVSSELASMAKLDPNNLNDMPSGLFNKATDYANSKLCNILFTNELSRKLKGTGVDANSVHPGSVQTDIFRNLPSGPKRLAMCLSKTFYKTTEEGAQTTIYCSVSKDIEGVTGAHFAECKRTSMPSKGQDEQLAKRVWDKSEELVKLTAEERQQL